MITEILEVGTLVRWAGDAHSRPAQGQVTEVGRHHPDSNHYYMVITWDDGDIFHYAVPTDPGLFVDPDECEIPL